MTSGVCWTTVKYMGHNYLGTFHHSLKETLSGELEYLYKWKGNLSNETFYIVLINAGPDIILKLKDLK